jgi:hypothetical protein
MKASKRQKGESWDKKEIKLASSHSSLFKITIQFETTYLFKESSTA